MTRSTIYSAAFAFGLLALAKRAENAAAQQNDGLNVYNPGHVVLGDTLTVEWDGVGQNKFDLVMFEGSTCEGDYELDLCGQDEGCGDSKGDYNVIIPTSVTPGERKSYGV